MKRKWILLKILLGLVVLVSLLSFSDHLYKTRELQKIDDKIDYSDGIYFINGKVVENTLKSTHPDYPKMQAQRISVKAMEDRLNANPYVKSAQVYLENNGVLHTEIEQEIPVARVKTGNKEYYITKDATQIPLCKDFSAKVLMINGKILPEEYKKIVNLTHLINDDKLLKNHIIGMEKQSENSFILLVDDGSYVLDLGQLENLDRKLRNFKVFHQEFIENNAEMPYKKLSLKYSNQVVASK
ncbi:cell division protein FtsQ/DivIB [Ornithobacterium rhinotracheale]|uniref:Cell division protein FtsQ n=1 Tax=Ornithobacterium rhinotracheale (strain ATCC 51463 / DSM 15997 / CCUG 23171 / CIP 104009 / LMG 9086) TaxID=867902 RepID=I3ZYK3_ORNRL|nr:hypothetical protein [Ornithobacterium rhinotracheale]AFL96787.1 hypothetical protein Ornrh_0586 [Ornithobacterium rhinotracheale DSM 15997]AIQ00554.1 hypothetical protein Q785_06810 [Ornithobacterium rhinotracheale ORT-UMN 88]KGB66678.1 hypothetical protein Q787_06625 [Ornithobacterium rhinotracheale H06-030791]MBN3662447.1 hypothetical protein [Ornithobacterium rhinotracheale]MCK0194135.1 hypothetical protein [Ornithobacterium rhinotracheale]